MSTVKRSLSGKICVVCTGFGMDATRISALVALPNVLYLDSAGCGRLERNAKGFQEPSAHC